MNMDFFIYIINIILLTSVKLHYLCTILAQIYPVKIVEEEEKKISEQQTRFKGDGDERDDNCVKMFASTFHYWCQNHVATLSTCLPAHAYSLVRSICCFCRLSFKIYCSKLASPLIYIPV